MSWIERLYEGLDVIEIDHPRAGKARIAQQGAQLLSWTPPGHAHDVLWCSSILPQRAGQAIRGGIPVCWPWFGPHPTTTSRPQHGYARNVLWRVFDVAESAERVSLEFELLPGDCVAFKPEYVLVARLRLTLSDAGLSIDLVTKNLGGPGAPLSLALHTYFAVSDVGSVAIDGLDSEYYRDNTKSGQLDLVTQIGRMRLQAETIALFDDAPSEQTIIDPGLGRRIIIRRDGPGSTIVWNPGANAATMPDIPPGEERRFLCVESGCIGTRALRLAPGQSHRLALHIAVALI